MAKSESIESLLAPSLRVSRPVAACTRCRLAKIKCDGKLPACSACERSGKANSCSSANDEFAQGKERSYAAALEAAAQRLQKRIAEARSISGASGASGGAQRPEKKRQISGGQRREAQDVDELVSDFGFLTVNATSRDFHGVTSTVTISFAKLLLAATVRDTLPLPSETRLPPRYVITPYLNHYLDSIYVILPFFSETELMSSVSRAYQDGVPASKLSPLDMWYVRLVIAISAATQSQTRGDENDNIAKHHVAIAMELADYVLHPGSIAGLQALLLLVQYALVDPQYFDCWYLVGMASRLLVDLGLHCEPAPEIKIRKEVLDLRRRIFHTTYAMDRAITMSLGRAFSFTDDSAPDIQLPTLATDLEQRSPSSLFLRSLKPSLFLFDIRRVQSAFYQKTRWSSRGLWSEVEASTYTSSVLNDVSQWFASIPDIFSSAHQVLFQLECLYSQLLVVAPNQKVLISSLSEVNKALIFEYSVQYAEKLQPIVRGIQWHPFMTCADLYRTKYIGRQFLEIMWSNFDQLLKTQHLMIPQTTTLNQTPLDNCNRAITCLKNLTQILDFGRHRWGVFDLRDKFEQESAVLMGRLKNRQQEFSAAQYTPPVLTAYQPATTNIPLVMGNQPMYSHDDLILNQSYGNNGSYLQGGMSGYENPDYPIALSTGLNIPSGNQLPRGTRPRRSYEFLGRTG